jgi:hypothetical protein
VPDTTRTTVGADSSDVAVRTPPASALAAFRGDPQYNYRRGWSDEVTGWWEQALRWLVETFLVPVFGAEHSGTVLRLILYAGIFVVLVAGFYQLAQMSPRRVLSDQEEGGDDLSAEVIRSETHDVDFDARIEAAVQAENYRRAVRLLYLQALRRLSRAGLVDVRPEKTNVDYRSDLDGTPYADPFADATRIFEYVWYGHVDVTARTFDRIRSRFASLSRALEERSTQ